MTDQMQTIIEAEMVALEGSQLTTSRGRMNELLGQVERMEVTDRKTYAMSADIVKIINSDIKKLDEARLEETKKPRMYVDWINGEFNKITGPLKAALKSAKAKRVKWADAEEARLAEIARKEKEDADAAALELAQKAEAEQKAADEDAKKARDEEQAAEAAGDDAAAEKARQEAEMAEQASDEYGAEAEAVLDSAANTPVVDARVAKVRSDLGTVSGSKKVWRCEVTNLRLLMIKTSYLSDIVANDPKVNDAVRKAVQKAAISAFQTSGEPIPGLKIHQVSEDHVR